MTTNKSLPENPSLFGASGGRTRHHLAASGRTPPAAGAAGIGDMAKVAKWFAAAGSPMPSTMAKYQPPRVSVRFYDHRKTVC